MFFCCSIFRCFMNRAEDRAVMLTRQPVLKGQPQEKNSRLHLCFVLELLIWCAFMYSAGTQSCKNHLRILAGEICGVTLLKTQAHYYGTATKSYQCDCDPAMSLQQMWNTSICSLILSSGLTPPLNFSQSNVFLSMLTKNGTSLSDPDLEKKERKNNQIKCDYLIYIREVIQKEGCPQICCFLWLSNDQFTCISPLALLQHLLNFTVIS